MHHLTSIRHGRDHKLRVWQLDFNHLGGLEKTLPAAGASPDQPQPWLLHSMDISALNFCTIATCPEPDLTGKAGKESEALLIATPNGLDNGTIDIFHLPSERRISQLKSDKTANAGMVMAVRLLLRSKDNVTSVYVVSGYENGQVMLHVQLDPLDPTLSKWQKIITCKAHSQPVLSLGLAPSHDFFVTSSADATISKFELPSSRAMIKEGVKAVRVANTKHAGQQGLSIRSDGKIFATAGWDARVRVYSLKTLKELAVLQWHKSGCYSTAFVGIAGEAEFDAAPPTDACSTDAVQQSALDTIRQERIAKAQKVHWLAVGGKDGTISLWDIY